MRFTLTDEQRAFRQEVCQFLSRELAPEVVAAHRDPNEARGWPNCSGEAPVGARLASATRNNIIHTMAESRQGAAASALSPRAKQ